MEFRDNEAIYLQIAAFVSENILMGKWPGEQKIPSVRDLAVELEVNPNTVMRSYEFLQNQGVIYNKRGLGLFVAPDGYDKIKAYRRDRFIEQDLQGIFRNMYLLDISFEEMQQWFEQFKRDNYKSDNNNENKL
ncbi:GntR family transcriptional regulator [Mucilaginibacter gotjawali]|uniref:HTH-type transcriptional repressor YtrA n=2 Tax=Mucilaginibacter gotjawali TaxID=1550579 RepID=A0A110B2Y8_9SPHI|nr:GntR family transcriptional regulator [Mucilaginibacter gotjawali]MBB3054058.1 DNA-binding transcriptional regulator YhcF (GntR family) [Mucilaginibacter gotjawali]BAU54327.1 HTH-type transcriptional repressor YtrA [Mucilaginibacter gotjawali]